MARKIQIPLFDIRYPKSVISAVSKIVASGWLSQGKTVEIFESEFAKFCGRKYAIALSSGTAALEVSLSSLGISKRDEVILPSMTFVAVANAIVRAGATPVFVDITSLKDPFPNPDDIEAKITSKTTAIIVPHFAGFLADSKQIYNIAKKHRLAIIEDASHSPRATIGSRRAGNLWSDIACFSFYSNKLIPIGEGGMLLTDNKQIYERSLLFRSQGRKYSSFSHSANPLLSDDVTLPGWNYRTSEISAAIGLQMLATLNQRIAKREIIFNNICEKLKYLMECHRDQQSARIINTPQLIRGQPVHYLFPILTHKKGQKKLRSFLSAKGIATSVHYPPTHLFSFYRSKFGYKRGMLPITEEFSERELTLPLYECLTLKNISYIGQNFIEYFMKLEYKF